MKSAVGVAKKIPLRTMTRMAPTSKEQMRPNWRLGGRRSGSPDQPPQRESSQGDLVVGLSSAGVLAPIMSMSDLEGRLYPGTARRQDWARGDPWRRGIDAFARARPLDPLGRSGLTESEGGDHARRKQNRAFRAGNSFERLLVIWSELWDQEPRRPTPRNGQELRSQRRDR